jgi:eukaryotic-like serine/threonine-protein kinase
MKTCPVCDTPYPNQHATCPTDGAVLIETRELAPGHIVRSKYRIVRKLGQGGMGVVYLAEHSLLGGQVALKFLAVELSRNPQFVKRFRNEARAAYQLRHPNIAEVADLDQDEDGCLFIAMEYVAGPSLRTVLREAKGPLSVPRALYIAAGVASGLAVAHSRGAVHRDIKPENILLRTAADGTEQPKVLDFGIAAMTDNITNLSQTHGLLLTPEYAAPEQWRGMPASELDGRTDLYALGGVLYEMLAGQTPFRASNPEGWMFQHLQGVAEPLEQLRPDLGRDYPGVGALVMSLLARDREQRVPSATTVLEMLAQLMPSAVIRTQHPTNLPMIAEPRPAAVSSAVSGPQPVNVTQPPPTPEPAIPTQPRLTARSAALTELPLAETASPGPPSRRAGIGKWASLAALIVLVAAAGIWVGGRYFRPVRPVAIPVLAPAGGTYPQPIPVSIIDPSPNSTIHFTTDGNPPSEKSPVYTKPLDALPSGAVVRAMATAPSRPPSGDVTGVYIWTNASGQAENPQGSDSYDLGKSAYDHKQYAEARKHFGHSCDVGELRSCNYLGFLYAQGLGGARDAEKARTVYQDACDRGNLSSCASLGSMYQDGGNNDEARKEFKKACDGGLAEACNLLRAVP